VNTLYLLAKEIQMGMKTRFKEHDLITLYLVILALAYITSFLLICIGWYIYEWIIMGHLNTNEDDTVIALKWSFLLTIPIVDFYLKILRKKLNE
jgi:hypothetical protein